MINSHRRRSKSSKAWLSSEGHSLRMLSREEHNLMGINKDKSLISAGVREHDNMATAEIEIECSQPSCLGNVTEDDTDESYFSNFGESCVCVNIFSVLYSDIFLTTRESCHCSD